MCLVVSIATPESAVAVPAGAHPSIGVPQHYTAADGTVVSVERDGFGIGSIVPPGVVVGAAPSGAGSAGAVRPVAGTIPTAGGFGGRSVSGCSACSTNHLGLDFAAGFGAPVVAALPGRVVSAEGLGGYGNQVLLQHPDGTQTRYGHLSRIGVAVGQTVTAGQFIGAVGSTGVSTGPHLHFEVILGGTPVDPAPWLAARGLL